MRTRIHSVLTAILLLFAITSFSQTSLPLNTVITENFNALGASSTASLPANWKFSAAGAGVSATWSSGTNTSATTLAANSGMPAIGGRYNWGTTAGTDRAIGFLTDGSYNSSNAVMAYYRNTTGSTATSVTVSFSIKRFVVNTGSFSLSLDYSKDGSNWIPLAAGAIGEGVFASAVNAGTFGSPQTVFKSVAIAVSGGLANNSDIYFRWTFTTTDAASQGLGLDNVSVFAGNATPELTAQLRDILQVDNGMQNQYNEGDVIRYRTVIKNIGTADALGVQINLPSPPNKTTPISNSIKTSAVAKDDNFSTAYNTVFNSGNVLTNDFGIPSPGVLSFGPTENSGATAAGGTGVSDNGGTVTVNADGSFSYTPPIGFIGVDKFTYVAGNGNLPNNDAIVTINIGNAPTTADDSYAVIGNVSINPSGTYNLLNNDAGSNVKVTAVNGGAANVGSTITTSNGSSLTVNSDGSFAYNPAKGFRGPTETFTYTIDNGFSSPATATVTLNISGMIWFVDKAAAAGGDGRLSSPFNSISAFQAVNTGSTGNPGTGDYIFVYENATAYSTSSLTLLQNQKLIGQDASQSLQTITGYTVPGYSAALPVNNVGGGSVTLSNTATVVTLSPAGGNLLQGFALNTSAGSAVALSGVATGNNTLTDLIIAASGTANGINLATTSYNGSFSYTSGSLTNSGTGTAFNINGNTANVTCNVNVTQSGNGAMVNVTNHSSGTILFQTGTLSATNGTGLQFTNADGTYNFTGTTTLNGGDAGIDILSGSGGSFTFNSTTSITNPVNEAIKVNASAATVTYSGTFSKTNSGTGISIGSETGGTITINGSGTKTLGTSTVSAINLTANTGATINFSGNNLFLTTTTGAGFTATGGGTISVSGTGNTISSGTGTALNVQNTTIGSSGLNFKSISANGGINGIVLNNTGSSGGLTVLGDGASDAAITTRGRITAKQGGGTVALGSGGSILNTTGHAVSLTGAASVVLRNLTIQNGNADGINATTVTGLTVDNVLVSGKAYGYGMHATSTSTITVTHSEFTSNATDAATVPAADIRNVGFDNVSGTHSISTSLFQNAAEHVCVLKNTAGTTTFNVTNCTFSGAQAGDGLDVYAYGSSNVTANIQTITSSGNSSFGFDSGTETSQPGTFNLTVNGSTFTNNFVGLDVAHGSSGTNTFNITNNTFTTNVTSSAQAININRLGDPSFTGFGLFSGTVSGNIIGTAGVANSGSDVGDGITVKTNGNGGTTRIAVLNNIIRSYGQHGIAISARDATTGHTLEARVQNNNIANGEAGVSLDGINVTMGALNTDKITMCLNINSNTVTSAVRNGVRVRTSGSPAAVVTLTLPAYDGTGATYFANQNPAATGSVANTSFSNTTGTTSAGTCITP